MHGNNRPIIDEIYDDVIAVHAKAAKEHFDILTYLINAAVDEALSLRAEERPPDAAGQRGSDR